MISWAAGITGKLYSGMVNDKKKFSLVYALRCITFFSFINASRIFRKNNWDSQGLVQV
jgi:hypothetical protein